MTVRTVWPLNGSVHYGALEEPAPATLIKRMPWSSVLLTALWFLTVAVGMLIYVASYALAGGFSSVGGAFLAVTLCGLGLLVLLFGMVVVVAGYRMEDKRLMAVYEEFKAVLAEGER
jgi:cation transporter-like permease